MAAGCWVFAIAILCGTPDVILMVRNAAVLEGKRIPLHCNTADEEHFLNIVWLKYKHLISDGSVDTVDGGVIIGYSSSVTNKALCDRCRFLTLTWTNTLYIENANVSDAGVYSCIKTATSTTTYGHVTILRHPECQQPPATPVIANTRMEYSCSVCVTGRGVPSMQWNVTALPHTSAQRDTVLSGPFVCSSATLRVDASPERNGFTFECCLTFVVPLINVSNYARNAPGYHYTFTTTLLSVLYAPTFLKVTPLRRTYDVGDTVTANTDGNPIATISWFDSGTLSAIETGRTMPVTPDFAGRCYVIAVKAVNPLGGLSATLRFRVPAVNFSATTSAGGGYNGSSRNVTSGKPLPATAVPPRTGDNAAKRRIVRKILTFVVLPLILLVLVTSVCHVIRKSRGRKRNTTSAAAAAVLGTAAAAATIAMNERTTLIVRRSGNPPPMSPTKETPKWPLVTKDTVDMERKTNNSKATHQAVIDRTRHKEPTQRVEVPEKPRRNTNDALLTKRERSAAALGRDRKNSVPKQQREIYCPELRRVAKNGEVKMTNKKKQKKTPPPPTTTKHKHSAVK